MMRLAVAIYRFLNYKYTDDIGIYIFLEKSLGKTLPGLTQEAGRVNAPSGRWQANTQKGGLPKKPAFLRWMAMRGLCPGMPATAVDQNTAAALGMVVHAVD
ncbi:MAG: hypothetical protein E2576_01675 [Alcaligenaceae bacterium]|nr:hypothetical protein [Alcaligenaceae bacterium SAGV5]MPS53154.1 hypothetical protein [Alcaligenaceae bacterium SAGV3]MPT55408.1 hypothetical protein [Alcaligenaceae bacterium]